MKITSKQRVQELAGVLKEAQKDTQFDNYLRSKLSALEIITPEWTVLDNGDKSNIKEEVGSSLRKKINQLHQSNFDYPHAFVFKLGKFQVKKGGIEFSLKFEISGNPLTGSDFGDTFAIIIVHDTLMNLILVNDFTFQEKELRKLAKEFIDVSGIYFKEGKVNIFNDLNFANYITIPIEELPGEFTPTLPDKNLKTRYSKGEKFYSQKYGDGLIQSVKHIGEDGGKPLYEITVDFPREHGRMTKKELLDFFQKHGTETIKSIRTRFRVSIK